MAISIGGLASGIDTNSLIDALMEAERLPLYRMEDDRNELNSRLNSFKKLDGHMGNLLEAVEKLATSEELLSRKSEQSSEEYFATTAGSEAQPGNYEVKVLSLAQVEKVVYQGVADKDAELFTSGTVNLQVGGNAPIALATADNTLDGIMEAINALEDPGITASIVNDGSGTPYRLVLTGDSVQDDNITIDASGVSGGTGFPTVELTRSASQAQIEVDGISIVSDSNTISGAIPGITFDLTKADEVLDPADATTTTLTVGTDEEAIVAKVEDFVDDFNDILSFLSYDGLSGDSAARSVKRSLQNLLTNVDGGTGVYQSLSTLGIETDERTGDLVIDSTALKDMIENNLDDFETFWTGDTGFAGRFVDYLEGATDSIDGLYAGRKKSTEASVSRIDDSISSMLLRLEKRESILVGQFSAMEQLVSTMNSQSNYLAQQMSIMASMGSK